MVLANSVKEAIEKVKGKSLYIETDDCYWVDTGSGIIRVLKPLREKVVKHILQYGRFPEKYILEITKAKQTKTLSEVMKRKDNGILISGKAGIGKTFSLIYKIAEDVKNHKIKAPLYISLQDYEYLRDFFTEKQTIKEFDSYLLDDLNMNIDNKAVKFVINTIYHAYNYRKKLYITTNATAKEILKFLNEEPIISRIIEMCDIIEIKEHEDLRVKR